MTHEEKKEYQRKWYAEHREQQKANRRRWKAEHREQEAANKKRWNAEHSKQQKDNIKRWQIATSASVYEITNLLTGKKYIGSTTINIKRRWINHKNNAKTKPHLPLYADMNKNGIENFKIEVLFLCPKDQARKAEQFVIDAFGGELYNKYRAVKL